MIKIVTLGVGLLITATSFTMHRKDVQSYKYIIQKDAHNIVKDTAQSKRAPQSKPDSGCSLLLDLLTTFFSSVRPFRAPPGL